MRRRIAAALAALAAAPLLAAVPGAAGAAGPVADDAGPEPLFAPAAGAAAAYRPAKLTRYHAYYLLRRAGISVWSSGGCMRRHRPTCTSLDNINKASILGALALRRHSRCPMTVTGGTEVGHELPYPTRYTHYNGYKLDFALHYCLNRYIVRNFRYIGGATYRAASGNLYYREPDHWDVLFFSCGC